MGPVDDSIESLPSCLSAITLNKIQFDKFTRELGHFPNLKYLDLDFAKCSQTELADLFLPFCDPINTEHPLSYLTSLKSLTMNMPQGQMTEIPEWLEYLTNLTSLSLPKNHLTNFPESFGELLNLNYLYAPENQLKVIPETFGNLTNLTYLVLSENKLTELPESIGNLTNLTTLHLFSNELTSLPKSIENLTNLSRLYLNDNPISNVEQAHIQALLPNCDIGF